MPKTQCAVIAGDQVALLPTFTIQLRIISVHSLDILNLESIARGDAEAVLRKPIR